MYIKWTEEQKNEMKELYLSGSGPAEIGRLFGVSRYSIYEMLKRFGVTADMHGLESDKSTKLCVDCKVRFPLERFDRILRSRDGLRSVCKDCRAIKKSAYYQANKKEILQKLKDERPGNREKNRRSDLKKKFKITLEQFNEMLDNQGNCCFVCKTSNPGGAYDQWHIDHDHSCCGPELRKKTCGNCIRGILCSNCNLALGTAKDSATILRALADYIDAYELHKIFKD